MKEVLKVVNLCKKGILNDLSFSVSEGEMVAIMGPSGSGKSSLLYQISGMDCQDAGEVWLCEQMLGTMSEDERAKMRLQKVGFVFQHMFMLRNLTIKDNIMFPALQLKGKKEKHMIGDRAEELMKSMNIKSLENRDVFSVSGGELQRACICRSLINQPDIILADEPTGALNRRSAQDVLEVFKRLNEGGVTILMVTHDSKVASVCDRILYLIDGSIQGELSLVDVMDSNVREDHVSDWLARMGW